MQLPYYDFQISKDALNFEFESVSETRRIRKLIEFRQIDKGHQLYNLALVDVTENGQFSDSVVSNNKDMPKILATVAQTLLLFFRTRPDANVIFSGSTPACTE